MKHKLSITITTLLITLSAGAAHAADDAQSHHGGWDRGRGGQERGWDHGGRGSREEHRGGHQDGRRRGKFLLSLGLCAGQKLAKAGVTLPERKPGERLDDATRKAIWDNVKACKEEFKAAWEARRGSCHGKDEQKPGEQPKPSEGQEDGKPKFETSEEEDFMIIEDLADSY